MLVIKRFMHNIKHIFYDHNDVAGVIGLNTKKGKLLSLCRKPHLRGTREVN